MQNLVSKNPVQRFKQGRKIIKAYGGDSLRYNEDYDSLMSSVQVPQKQQQDTPVTGKTVSNKSPLWDINYKIDNYINGLNAAQQGKIIDSKSVVPRSMRAGYNDYKNSQSIPKQTITKPINNRWVNGIQKRNEITDVRATQQMLKDAGFDIGKYGVDGKWGKDTENAYQQYLALKNVPTYEKTPEQTVDISSPSKVLNSNTINQEPVTVEQQTEQAIINNNLPVVEKEGQKYFARTGNYNKSQLRNYMRSMGLNPYDFKGSERKALRLWLNGQSDDNSLLTRELRNLFVTPYGYKQGGQLVSRNPIKRFKNKK